MVKMLHRVVWGAAVVEFLAVVVTAGYLVRREAPAAGRCEAAVVQVEREAADDPVVYVVRGSRRYHRRSCRYVRSSGTAMRVSEAKARYRPCPRCKPAW
jgi:hypothetical protein